MNNNIKIDTSSYKWWRGKEPNGIDYYNFEVHFEKGARVQTYLFNGDYNEALEKINKKYNNIIKIIVSI